MSALELHAVTKRRGGGAQAVLALLGVSLSLEPGEVVLVEGPSGSGKTTLLTISAGLLMADEGEVKLGGVSLAMLTPAALRAYRARNVGFVFQRANLLDGLDVRDNVLVAAALAGIPREQGRAEADRLLAALQIDGLATRSPRTLSGGEEHRVAIARALVHHPQVVFADEPTGNLDGVAGRAVAEALTQLARQNDVAVLVATHDARLREHATRRLTLIDGVLSDSAS